MLVVSNAGHERPALVHTREAIEEALAAEEEQELRAGGASVDGRDDAGAGGKGDEEDNNGTDADAELLKELAALKEETGAVKRIKKGDGGALAGATGGGAGKRFLLIEYDTGVKGLGFLRVLSSNRQKDEALEVSAKASAAEFAAALRATMRILREAGTSGRCFSQKVIKVVPVAGTCFADPQAVRQCAAAAIAGLSEGVTDRSDAGETSAARPGGGRVLCPPLALVPGYVADKDRRGEGTGAEKDGSVRETKAGNDCGGDVKGTEDGKSGPTGASFGVIYEHRGSKITRDIVIEMTAKLLDGTFSLRGASSLSHTPLTDPISAAALCLRPVVA